MIKYGGPVAAANAITVLNRAGVQFNHFSFEGVQSISGADLSGAIMERADFASVKMDQVDFRGVDHHRAKITSQQLQSTLRERTVDVQVCSPKVKTVMKLWVKGNFVLVRNHADRLVCFDMRFEEPLWIQNDVLTFSVIGDRIHIINSDNEHRCSPVPVDSFGGQWWDAECPQCDRWDNQLVLATVVPLNERGGLAWIVDGNSVFWLTGHGEPEQELEFPEVPPLKFIRQWNGGEWLAIAAEQQTVLFLNTEKRQWYTVKMNTDIEDLCFLGCHWRVAHCSISGSGIYLWDLRLELSDMAKVNNSAPYEHLGSAAISLFADDTGSTLYSGGIDGRVKQWLVGEDIPPKLRPSTYDGHSIKTATISPDGRFVCLINETEWVLLSDKGERLFSHSELQPEWARFSPDSKTLIVHRTNMKLLRFSLETMAITGELPGSTKGDLLISSAFNDRTGHLFIGGFDNRVTRLDPLNDGGEVPRLEVTVNSTVNCMAVSPNGQWLAAVTEGNSTNGVKSQLLVINAETMEVAKRYQFDEPLWSVVFYCGEEWLFIGTAKRSFHEEEEHNHVKVFHWKTGRLAHKIDCPVNHVVVDIQSGPTKSYFLFKPRADISGILYSHDNKKGHIDELHHICLPPSTQAQAIVTDRQTNNFIVTTGRSLRYYTESANTGERLQWVYTKTHLQ